MNVEETIMNLACKCVALQVRADLVEKLMLEMMECFDVDSQVFFKSVVLENCKELDYSIKKMIDKELKSIVVEK